MVRFSVFSHPTVRALGAVAVLALAPAACASDPAATGRAMAEPGISLAGNYLAGRHAQATGDTQAASVLLLRAAEQDPDNTALRRAAFAASLHAGQIAPAIALARGIVTEDDPFEIAHLLLAVETIRTGDTDAALKHLKPLEDRETFNFLTPLLHAWIDFGGGHTENAVKRLDELGKREGFETIAGLHQALMKAQTGDGDGAQAAFDNLLSSGMPLSLRVVQLMGAFHLERGDIDKARAVYGTYDEGRPGTAAIDTLVAQLNSGAPPRRYVATAADGTAEALMGLAGALSQGNARETAEIFLRLALYLKPDFPSAQLLLAGLMEADGRREEAAVVYDRIAAGSPLALSAKIRNADNLDRLNRTEEAIKVLREIATARPSDPQPMMDLGDILRRHERFDEAVDAYDEAVARIGPLSKRQWTLLYTRGIALERSRNWTRAEKDFLKALEFEPEQPLVLNYLGYTWVEKGKNLTEAENMIRKAVSLRPNDGYIVDSLGWVLYRLGRPAEAVKEMERAVELRPEDPVINDHLGDVYWAVGRTREALFQWKRVLSLEPDAGMAETVRAKIKDGLPVGADKDG